VVSAGSRSNATAVRPAPAYHSALSAGRGTRPIWKLEAALKCRSCKKGRYAPPVHMIKLTATRESRLNATLKYAPDEDSSKDL
jgi:hypothetical protein